jgi:hypothetical protein
MRGSGKRCNSASLISPAYESFPTPGNSFPVDRVYNWRLWTEAPLAEGGPPTGSSSQLLPTQVTFDHDGEEDPSVGIRREKVVLIACPEILQVPEAPAAVAVTSPSCLGEASPPLKKVCTKGYVPPYPRA